MSHLGLSGIFFRITSKDKTPKSPMENKNLQFYISPNPRLRPAAIAPPKCHVPSIPMFTLPRYFGGRNSSIAVNIAVNSPPTLLNISNYLTPVKNLPSTKSGIDPFIREKKIPTA
jgi:hypothetical protein